MALRSGTLFSFISVAACQTFAAKAHRDHGFPAEGSRFKTVRGMTWTSDTIALACMAVLAADSTRWATAALSQARMASAPVRGSIKARQGLGSLSASSHSTATGASQVSAKHSSRKLCQAGPFREQRLLVALAHPSSRSCEQSQHGNRGGVAGPLHVYAPAKEDYSTQRSSSSSSSSESTNGNHLSNNAVPATSLALEPEGHGQSITVSSSEILAPVRADMEQLTVNLKAVVGERSNLLKAAADQIFGAGGKRLRPAIVFMVSRATAKYTGLRWASISAKFTEASRGMCVDSSVHVFFIIGSLCATCLSRA